MSDSLRDLPLLQVSEVTAVANDGIIVRGRLEGWSQGTDGTNWFWLWASQTEAVIPVIQAIDTTSGQVTLLINKEDTRDTIRPGVALHWMSSYWQAYHVPMIRDGGWSRRDFKAEDAIHFEVDGKKGWTSTHGTIPEGAKQTHIEPKGWDHEHCEICHGSIGVGGSSFGYINDKQMWLCPECYERWAVPRSLKFLVDT